MKVALAVQSMNAKYFLIGKQIISLELAMQPPNCMYLTINCCVLLNGVTKDFRIRLKCLKV